MNYYGLLCHAYCIVATILVITLFFVHVIATWDLKPRQEHKILLYELVYIAVCGSMLSITAK